MEAHKVEQATGDELARCLEAQPERFGPDSLRALAARVVSLDAESRALEWLDELGLLEAFERGDEEPPAWVSLDDYLNSGHWDAWRAEHHAHLAFSDPERFGRMMDAAENGADGSTHGEVLEDMRRGVKAYARENVLLPGNEDSLLDAIASAERWHERAGTLDQVTG